LGKPARKAIFRRFCEAGLSRVKPLLRKQNMTNLREVAELAGVSIATASMALRGEGNLRESTRTRVRTCAKRLSYTPNQIGRTLNTGKANAIALLMMTSVSSADIVRGTSLFYHLVRGVLSVVDEAKHGLRLDVKSHEDPDLMQYFDQVVGGRSLDGIIIVPQFVRDYAFIHTLKKNNFPYVLMRPASFGRDINYVDLQSDYGAQLVAELFAKQGRRRVAMINGPAQHLDAVEREKGFMQGLAGAGLDRLTIRYGDFTIPSGIAAMKDILREVTPDAGDEGIGRIQTSGSGGRRDRGLRQHRYLHWPHANLDDGRLPRRGSGKVPGGRIAGLDRGKGEFDPESHSTLSGRERIAWPERKARGLEI
jgi:DNA-binding LacI/PurR family transcriptional regulator